MNMITTTPIASINLDEKSQKNLNVILQYFLKDKFVISDNRDEEICLIQVNSSGSEAILTRYIEQHPNCPIITISEKKRVTDNYLVSHIGMPVSPKALSDALLHAKSIIKPSVTVKVAATAETIETPLLQSLSINPVTLLKNAERPVNSKATMAKRDIKEWSKSVFVNTNDSVTAKSKYSKSLETRRNMKTVSRARVESIVPVKTKETQLSENFSIEDAARAMNSSSFELENAARALASNKSTTNSESRGFSPNVISMEAIAHGLSSEKVSIDEIAKISEIKDLLQTPSTAKKKNLEETIMDTGFHKFTSTRSDIDLDDLYSLDKLVYLPEEYLQGKLQSLYSSSIDSSLRTAHGDINYYAEDEKVALNINDLTLRSFASLPSKRKSDYPNVAQKPLIKVAGDESKELSSSLLWKSAIWASGGRLPISTNIDTAFKIKHWPNYTRLMMVPHSMEILALWAKDPISLRETLQNLQIPQRYVFSLYSAVLAIDLVEFNENQLTTPPIKITPKTAQKDVKPKGFVGKLLRYLSKDNVEEEV